MPSDRIVKPQVTQIHVPSKLEIKDGWMRPAVSEKDEKKYAFKPFNF